MRQRAGMTLIEVMIATLVFCVLTGALYGAFNVGSLSWRIDQAGLDVYQPLRLAMDGMTREIRQSTPNNVAIENGTAVEFFVGGSDIKYYLSGENLTREHPEGVVRTIARDVTALNFELTNATVTIVAQGNKVVNNKNIGITLTEKVRLRNED